MVDCCLLEAIMQRNEVTLRKSKEDEGKLLKDLCQEAKPIIPQELPRKTKHKKSLPSFHSFHFQESSFLLSFSLSEASF